MKHTNKKGFTIVELVIVIAVIAILAAVLIPTFTNLVKKANQSADMQAARQMSTVLSAEPGIGNDIDKVIDLLVEAGYNAAESLKPITKDHAFYYFVDGEFIALVDTAKGEVVFPEGVEYVTPDNELLVFDLGAGAKYIDVVANDSAALQNAITAGSNKIDLTADATFTTATSILNGDTINVNLGNHTLTTGPRPTHGTHYAMKIDNGDVTIKNGSIVARGIELYGTSSLVLENVNVSTPDATGGACVYNGGTGSVTITGGVFEALNGDFDTPEGINDPGVIYNTGKVTVKAGTFTSVSNCYQVNNYGEVIIDDGVFTASRGAIATYAGATTTINGGTFAAEGADGGHVLYAEGTGKIVVNGGTFTGTLSGTAETLLIKGGTFSVDPSAYVDAAAYNVTANADGTWTVTAK